MANPKQLHRQQPEHRWTSFISADTQNDAAPMTFNVSGVTKHDPLPWVCHGHKCCDHSSEYLKSTRNPSLRRSRSAHTWICSRRKPECSYKWATRPPPRDPQSGGDFSSLNGDRRVRGGSQRSWNSSEVGSDRSITFIGEKLAQQGRQLNGVAGVREVQLSVPLEAVHLRVPLHPVERDSLSCPSGNHRSSFCCWQILVSSVFFLPSMVETKWAPFLATLVDKTEKKLCSRLFAEKVWKIISLVI